MIRIITDSTCDLTKEDQERLGIHIVPLKVLFGTKEYIDGVDIDIQSFYEKLATEKELPTTAQVNPGEFEEVFKTYLEQGDEIIAILLSSQLSGTYQSAAIAKDMLSSEKIHLIDSKTVTLGLALLVEEAAKLRDKGLSAKEIIAAIEELKEKVNVIAIVDTLKYLQKGGRISSASAILGTALGIKPIIQIKDGVVQVIGKERGQKKLNKFILSHLEGNPIDLEHAVVFAHSIAEEAVEQLQQLVKQSYNISESHVVPIGSTVGTHAGPGATGIAYIKK